MSNLKKNFAFQLIYQILTMILPFITAPYISRVLGAENLGLYSYTYTICNYFVLFAMLGINNHGSRLIAQIKDDKTKLNTTFSSLYILHLIISIIVIMVYLIYVLLFEQGLSVILFIQGINIISAGLDINWLFFGLEKFKVTVVKNTIIKIICVVCIIALVKSRNDLIVYTIIMVLGNFLSQIVLWMSAKKDVKFVKPDRKILISSIKPMFILFIAVIATSFYRSIDKVMLGKFDSMSVVGCYENADKIIMFPISLITALGTIMLPRMSMLYKKNNMKQTIKYIDKSIEFSLILSYGLLFGLVAVGERFSILFFGDEFSLTGQLIKFLSITIPIIAFNNVIRTQYIIPNNKDRIYVTAVLIGSLINFTINYVLIPKFGSSGAVIGTIIAYSVVFLYQCIKVNQELNITKYLKKSIFPFICGILMCIIVTSFGMILKLNIISLIAQILIGIISYFLLLYIFLKKNSDSYFMEFLNKIKIKK